MKDSFSITMADQPKQKISRIISDYGSRLFGFIRGKVNSNEDAEDILQEVWFQLSRSVNLEDIDQISGWLFKVARNKIIDKGRKMQPERLEDYSDENETHRFLIKEILLLDSDDTEVKLFKELFWQKLFQALEELPANQRQVYIWNELEDMTLQQIADKTGKNLKTVISRKGYAVKHLRKRLETLYTEFFES